MTKDLIILTSPPASGKTYFVQQLAKKLSDVPVVISPLRALANECLNNWGEACVVMTPEEWMRKPKDSSVVVIDEFHLFFYWGDTFRPVMWEAFYEIVQKAEVVILLTATLDAGMQEVIKNFDSQFHHIQWWDFGNQRLRFVPTEYIVIKNEEWMKNLILHFKWGGGVHLIFCHYRSQVRSWQSLLEQKGYRVWSCVGGEANVFSEMMGCEEAPDFIIATSVLSHGVNLPQIKIIFLFYAIEDLNFWIQMVARGGRKGESFTVYALEKPYGLKWSPWNNLLAHLRLSLKMRVHLLTEQIQEWFLKA